MTCVALSTDEASIYSGSKDNSVLHWDTETGKKKTVLRPRWSRATHGDNQAWEGEVLCVANTSDGRYIVSSGRDKSIRVYDSRLKHSEIKCLTGHRDVVTCLSFRRDSYSLFSGSMDRCLKHWDLNEMGYLETMFGHQVSKCYDFLISTILKVFYSFSFDFCYQQADYCIHHENIFVTGWSLRNGLLDTRETSIGIK